MYQADNPYNPPEKKAQLNYAPMQINPTPIKQVDLSSLEEKADGLKSAQEFTGKNNAASAVKGSGIGKKALNNADGIAAFASKEYNNMSIISGSSDESRNQAVGSTLEGASLGFQVAGPWGALVGAVIGAGVGIADANHDNKIRIKESDRYHKDLLAERKAQRRKEYQLSKGEQASNAKGNILGLQEDFTNRY